jgi:hypothetical protein
VKEELAVTRSLRQHDLPHVAAAPCACNQHNISIANERCHGVAGDGKKPHPRRLNEQHGGEGTEECATGQHYAVRLRASKVKETAMDESAPAVAEAGRLKENV